MPRINYSWDKDTRGRSVLVVEKKRGKFTLAELERFLLYDAPARGVWLLVTNASENVSEAGGWFEDERKGDRVTFYLYDDDGTCPICAALVVPEYCPNCGEPVRDNDVNGTNVNQADNNNDETIVTYPTQWQVTKNVTRYQVWRQTRELAPGEPMHSGVCEYYPKAFFDTREEAAAFAEKLNRESDGETEEG